MMSTGSILVLLSLMLLVVWYVTQPFFSPADRNKGKVAREDKQRELDGILDLIMVLDLDHELGKIPELEYIEQRRELESKAALLATLIKKSFHEREETREVAGQLRTQRKMKSPTIDGDPIEVLIARRKRARMEKTSGFCPNCGNPYSESDKYCPKCGLEIIDEER